LATLNGHVEVVKELVKGGARLPPTAFGLSLLDVARARGDLKLLAALALAFDE
jgi:hypothetical protein